MTSQHTGIMTVGKPAKDPNALKIASFRTKEGVWTEFCQKAESIGLTATDVIKAAMEQFINGNYSPYSIHTAVSTNDAHHDSVLTHNDVMEIVNTAVNTLSLPNHDDVMTRINDAIDSRVLPLIESATARVVASELLKTSTDATVLEELVKVNIDPHADRLAELETYTQSQFAAMRDELRAISNRSVTTEAVAQAHPKVVATVPDPVSPTDNGVEYLSFHQLASELGYVLPVELKDKPPQVRATALITFAASQGQPYGWNGKKQKLYRIEV
jgi:hypothetical protein